MITLKTLADATPQEVFDQVKNHLLTQNKKSQSYNNGVKTICKYKLDELKCAAGCLIDEDEYDSDFEGVSWLGLAKKGFVPNNHSKLIYELQSIHDINTPNSWKEKLKQTANRFNLKF